MIFEFVKKSYDNFNPRLFLLDSEYINFFLIVHILWWLSYGLVHILTKPNLKTIKLVNDTRTRYISILHASLIFWLSLYDLLYNQSDVCGDTNTKFQNKILLTTCAYFVYDLIACIILDVSDTEMVYHHLSCIIGSFCGVAYNNSANEMIRALIITEISCPIMHVRVILKNYDLKHTKSYMLMDFAYMVIYLIARCVYGAKNIYFTVYCWDNLLLVKIAGSFIWLQSVVFAQRMVGILKHRYEEYRERCKLGIRLNWLSHNKKVEELEYYKKSIAKAASYVP